MKILTTFLLFIGALSAHSGVLYNVEALNLARSKDYAQSATYWDSAYHKSPYWYFSSFNIITSDALKGKKYATKALSYYDSLSFSFTAESRMQHQLVTYLTAAPENKVNQAATIFDAYTNNSDSSYTSAYYLALIYNDILTHHKVSDSQKAQWLTTIEKHNAYLPASNQLPARKVLHTYTTQLTQYFEYRNTGGSFSELLTHYFTSKEFLELALFKFNAEGLVIPIQELKKDWLAAHLSDDSTLLSEAFKLTVSNPSTQNISWVNQLPQFQPDFESNWLAAIQVTWPTFEPGKDIQSYLNQHIKPQTWLVIDVWGTWCSPCKKELPMWQQFYEQHSNDSSKISFATLEYRSTNLEQFMADNAYSFPVYSITKTQEQAMGVYSYPTTFLVSPQGNYFILPFDVDKIELIHTLTQPKAAQRP